MFILLQKGDAVFDRVNLHKGIIHLTRNDNSVIIITTDGKHIQTHLSNLVKLSSRQSDEAKELINNIESNKTKELEENNNEAEEEDANMITIEIKYFDNEIDKVEKIDAGEWIDLRAAETIELKQFEFKLIPLGVGMKLPEGYEANIVPRSSTFKNFGILQTNSYGVVDNSYSGDNDQWFFPALAMRDTTINKNDRICQFRINKVMGEVEFKFVEKLGDVDRNGIGSTGVK